MEPICGKCGGPMSINPHPDAGKYEHYVEVGAKYECIPCQRANIHYRSNEMGRMSKAIDDLESQLSAYAELREAAEEYMNAKEVAWWIMDGDLKLCQPILYMQAKAAAEKNLFAALDKLEG